MLPLGEFTVTIPEPHAGVLTRPTWHEAEARDSEARESEAEVEAKEIFRGRGRGQYV